MRLMTQNIWNYNRTWHQRREGIAALILREQPDVVCVQETRHDFRYQHGKGQGEQLAVLTGYHLTGQVAQVFLPFPRVDEGLSILSRLPPLRTVSRRLTRNPWLRKDGNQRICLGVALEIGGVEVDVYDTHFSLSARARMTNARAVAGFIAQKSEGRPAFLLGDLNEPPDRPAIQYLTGPEAGFVDCWVAANPDDPGFTTLSWEPYHRIDYALARNVPGQVVSARIVGRERVDGVYASDHLGVVVDVDLSP